MVSLNRPLPTDSLCVETYNFFTFREFIRVHRSKTPSLDGFWSSFYLIKKRNEKQILIFMEIY
ncbi:hypothetical protein AA984_08975 [Brevibacillus formosus]|uniref:Uncharacterized protein n=1 Tax=Brevibacillus formosus TaxID=54913 RepID=A0A837KSW2_9BACL|nr:hypothetical protein AA984_08975 [Brevibacillus formosus]PSJ97482.1 hypothetical protein C7R91_09905 [Brevibacillus formosus]